MSGFGHEKPFEGETNDWITPKWVIDAFDVYAGDKGMFFDLDPCASMTQPWLTARNSYTAEQDGLAQSWYGMVWCNPPYGNNIGVWANKMAEHNNGIMLIFARLETIAWHENIFPHASGFLFPKGRIAFARPNGEYELDKNGRPKEAGAPSVFVSFGCDAMNVLFSMSQNKIYDGKSYRSGAFLHQAYV